MTNEHRRLLQIVYDAFRERAEWPFYQYVSTRVRRELHLEPTELYASIPEGLIRPSLDPSRAFMLMPETNVTLTIRGVRECEGSAGDLRNVVRTIRLIAARAEAFDPDPTEVRTLQMTSHELAEELGIPHGSAELARVFLLLRDGAYDLRTGFGGPSPDDSWQLTIDLDRAPRYRDIDSVDDFLARQQELEERQQRAFLRPLDEAISAMSRSRMGSTELDLQESGWEEQGEGRVFVSHATADKQLADELVELLRLGTDLTTKHFFYTSLESTGIPPGEDFVDFIKSQLQGSPLIVQLITPSYFQSSFCMCELGAQWILDRDCFPLIVPPMTYDDLAAVLGQVQAGRIDKAADLDQLYDRLRKVFGVDPPTAEWTKQKAGFLERLPATLGGLPIAETVERTRYDETVRLLDESDARRKAAEQRAAKLGEALAAVRRGAAVEEALAKIPDDDPRQQLEALVDDARGKLAMLPPVVREIIFHRAANLEFRVRPDVEDALDDEVAQGRLLEWRDEGAVHLNSSDPAVRRALEAARWLAEFAPDDPLRRWFESEYDLALDLRNRRVWEQLGLL
jgi:hypothetical protein